MRVVLLLLALVPLVAMASTATQSSPCGPNKSCMIDGDCDYGLCRRGQCTSGTTNVAELGQWCDDSLNNACLFSCSSARCQRGALANGCACDVDSDCRRNNCVDGVCKPFTLPVGAACANSTECDGAMDCVNGICEGTPAGSACTIQTLTCVAGHTCYSGNFSCLPTRGLGGSCLNSWDCNQGLVCDFAGVCVDASSKPTGAQCAANQECESGYCSSATGNCTVPLSVNAGDPCTDPFECKAGLKCVGQDDGQICVQTAGRLCSPSSPCSDTGGSCDCVGSYRRCRNSAFEMPTCELEEYRALQALNVFSFDLDLPTAVAIDFTLYPDYVQTAMATYMCCYYCGSASNYLNLRDGPLGQTALPNTVVCNDGPPHFVALSTEVHATKCTLTQKVTSASDLIQCGGDYPLAQLPGASSDESVTEKGWFIGLMTGIGVLICAVVVVVVLVVVRGAGGGGGGGGGATSKPSPATPSPPADKKEDEIVLDVQ